MLVKEVMNTDVKTIDRNSSIKEAAELMSEFSIGSLIVVVDSRVVGIITERDILSKLVAQAKNSEETKVKDIMTQEVIMVEPDIDIQDAADIMMEKKIKKLPVIKENHLVGIVTATDLCNASPKMIEQLGNVLLLPKKKRYVAG
jgi:CBS domain-containing protein